MIFSNVLHTKQIENWLVEKQNKSDIEPDDENPHCHSEDVQPKYLQKC